MTKKICVGIDDERLLGIKWKDAFIFPSSEPQNAHSNAIVLKPHDSFLIRKIYFEGADPRDEKWLLQISQLKENSSMQLS